MKFDFVDFVGVVRWSGDESHGVILLWREIKLANEGLSLSLKWLDYNHRAICHFLCNRACSLCAYK